MEWAEASLLVKYPAAQQMPLNKMPVASGQQAAPQSYSLHMDLCLHMEQTLGSFELQIYIREKLHHTPASNPGITYTSELVWWCTAYNPSNQVEVGG